MIVQIDEIKIKVNGNHTVFFKKLGCFAAFQMVLKYLAEDGADNASLIEKLQVRRDQLARELNIPSSLSLAALVPMANAKILSNFGISMPQDPEEAAKVAAQFV